jgi:hypothetical protein
LAVNTSGGRPGRLAQEPARITHHRYGCLRDRRRHSCRQDALARRATDRPSASSRAQGHRTAFHLLVRPTRLLRRLARLLHLGCRQAACGAPCGVQPGRASWGPWRPLATRLTGQQSPLAACVSCTEIKLGHNTCCESVLEQNESYL